MAGQFRWYDDNAHALARRYESIAAERVHAWLLDALPQGPALVLDVGSGSGRDAAWLAVAPLKAAVCAHANRWLSSSTGG